MGELLFADLSYQVRAVLYEVYNKLGPGFREETYKLAVLSEFRRRNIQVAREVEIEIRFKDEVIDHYRMDIVVEGKIILELKAAEMIHPRHEAQLLSYLKASGLQLGLLVNFGAEELKIKRLAHSQSKLR